MRVSTSFGEMPVQGLRANDPVRSATGTYVRVTATDKMHLDEDFLVSCPDAAPIVIPANCFGPGRPRNDLVVSPHQMLSTSANPAAPEFRRARDLLGRPGVLRRPSYELTYYLFHCGARDDQRRGIADPDRALNRRRGGQPSLVTPCPSRPLNPVATTNFSELSARLAGGFTFATLVKARFSIA